ncbi:MAG: FAD-binding oxidoreductase [Oscillospiraceae bacterium]|nr:FAD-binding oxidoreductase [Oscillospiraceae bacterium]
MITELLKELSEINDLQVITGDMIGGDYCHDEYPGGNYVPDAVIEANSTEAVSAVMALCSRAGVPVTVRGAGTGQMGGSVPVKGGIVLSLKSMNRVLGYNSETHILTVQPGVVLQDVKNEADLVGMYYPPDPGETTATIGGNVATNASGPCAVKYGRTADYVAEAVIVLANGIITDLVDKETIMGSEGTLAVITEIGLKLIEKPKADAILLFPFMDAESAINAAKAIMDAGYDPAVVEYMDTDLIEFSGNVTGNPVFPVEIDGERVGGTLMVTIEGEDDDNVMEKMETIAEMAEEGEIECLDILVGDSVSMKREFWAAHSAFHTSMESGAKSAREINIDVPADAMPEMIEFAKQLGEEMGVKTLLHAHVGSGGMHIHVASDLTKAELAPIYAEIAGEIYAKCVELGGNPRGEYGYGYGKIPYVTDDVKKEFINNKAVLDPKGILNPGKIVD